MKPVLKAVLSLSLIAFSIVALGCGSPAGGGTSQITISISAASAKATKAVPIDELRHVIVFSGPTGTQTHTITGSGTVKATVLAGLWTISVTAYDGDEVYATGSESVEVKAGRNTNVIVQMTLAEAEAGTDEAPNQALPPLAPDELIDNWTDLKNYIEGLSDLITPNNLVIERIVMLYDKGLIGGIKANDAILLEPDYSLPSGAEIKVTLVTPTNITTEITRDASFNWQMFIVSALSGKTATLNLGHPDYPQNSYLILNGAGSPYVSLIEVDQPTGGGTPVLNMYRNVTLKNNRIPSYGGAVRMGGEAIFNMFGGYIIGNNAGDGGGVSVSGTFKMSGGTISSNNATGNGGGVNVDNPTTIFEMGGNAIIIENSAANGGGVFVNDGTFSMKGGAITGNKTSYQGGGVSVSSAGEFTMSGGTIGPSNIIEGNTSAQGGGVYFDSNVDFIMSGNAAIIGNIAKTTGPSSLAQGGGVYLASTTANFKMDPGTPAGTPRINGNTAESPTNGAQGGGVYQDAGTSFTMNAGQINGNTAKGDPVFSNGGGVFVFSSSSFKKTAGEISGHPFGTTGLPSTGNCVLDVTTGLLISSASAGHAVFVGTVSGYGRASTAGTGVKLSTDLPPVLTPPPPAMNNWEF